MKILEKLKKIPPPLFCFAAVLLGVIAELIWPLVSISTSRYIVGGVLVVGSLLSMPSILIKFNQKKTPFDVRKSPSALITEGLYKLSRNPSYVALVVLCAGIGFLLSNLWVLIWLVPATIIIDRLVIPEEERNLEKAFGKEYLNYKSKVRRWL